MLQQQDIVAAGPAANDEPGQSERTREHLTYHRRKDMHSQRLAIDVVRRSGARFSILTRVMIATAACAATSTRQPRLHSATPARLTLCRSTAATC